MEKFYTLVTGNTLESHKKFVRQLIKGGATEVDSPDKSDVTIVFCPIVSRIETDIKAALSDISGFNPVILVVMHHTFNPNCTVSNSSRVVNNSSVVLVVDCLFYESRGLLDCQRNKDAVSEVLHKMDLPKALTQCNQGWSLSKLNPFKNNEPNHTLVAEKDKQLQHKDKELERTKKKLRETEDEVTKLKEELTANKQQLNQMKEENKKMKIELQKKSQDMDDQDMSWEDSSREGQDRDEQLENFQSAPMKMQEQVREKDKQLEMKDKLLEERNKQIEQQGSENSTQTIGKAKMGTFYTLVTGNTLESHKIFVQQLIQGGATEVDSPDKSNVTIVFCPIVSRIETDIKAALSDISGFNPVILVVMHHTFNPNCTVPNSSRVVNNSSVVLVVDCLFYESRGLLDCQRNKDAVSEVLNKMGLPKGQTQPNMSQLPSRFSSNGLDHTLLAAKDKQLQDKDRELDRIKNKLREKEKLLEEGNKQIEVQGKAKMEKFYTLVTGNTLESHNKFVQQLIQGGATEVDSPDQSDVTIVFCPIVSRIETDITAALSDISGFNPVILVVMHHTFNPNCTVSNSSRVVNNSSVVLVVDCLFYESRGLLDCQRNKDAVSEVLHKMDLPKAQTLLNRLWTLSGFSSNVPNLKRSENHKQLQDELMKMQQQVREKDKLLEERNKQIEQQEQKINDLETEMERLKSENLAQTIEKDKQLQDKDKELERLNNKFRENKDELMKMQEQVREKDKLVEERNKQIEHQEKDKQLQDKDKELERLNNTFREKDDELLKMQEQVREKDKLMKDKLVEERNKQIEHQGQKINDLETEMERLQGENSAQTIEKDKQLQDKDKELERLNKKFRENEDELMKMQEQVREKDKLLEERNKQIEHQGQKIHDLETEMERLQGENSAQTTGKANMGTFYTLVTGNTLESHKKFVQQLIKGGATEVDSPDQSDVTIVFCPIVSRNETDITAALSDISGFNPVILVVMHHTFNPNCTVPNSSRVVNNSSVVLVVDCLFYESRGLLDCQRNKDAVSEVLNKMDLPKEEKCAVLAEKGKQLQHKGKELETTKNMLREKDELMKMHKQLREKGEQIEHQGQKINDLKTEIERLKDENSAQTIEKDKQLQDKDKELERLNNKFRENEDELLKMQEQVRERDKLVEERNKQIEHQGQKINNLETEMERLQGENSAQTIENDKQLQDKDKELARTNKKFRENQDELLKMKEQVREKDKQLEMKDKLVEERNKQIKHQGQMINDLETDIESPEGENSAQTIEKDKQLQDKDKELERLNNKFREKDDELLKMKEHQHTLLAENDKQLQDKDKELERLNNKFREKDDELLKMQEQVREKDKLVEERNKQIEHQGQMINDLETDIESPEGENSAQTIENDKQLQDKDKELARTNKKFRENQDELLKMQEQVREKDKQLEMKDKLVEERNKQIEHQGQKINHLKTEMERLQSENSAQTIEKDKQLQDKDKELERLNNKFREKDDELLKMKEHQHTLLAENDKQLQDKDKELERLNNKFRENEDELLKMQEQVREKDKLVEERNKQIEHQGQKINDLETEMERLQGENSAQTIGKANMGKLYTLVTGNTLESHKKFVQQLIQGGATEVDSPDKSDVTIVFCPIVSRNETDITAALSDISGFNPVILVVMHHTFNPNCTVPNSSRVVNNSSVVLVVDCLFYESRGLLDCQRNKDAVSEVLNKMDLPKGQTQPNMSQLPSRFSSNGPDHTLLAAKDKQLQDKDRELDRIKNKLREKEKLLEEGNKQIELQGQLINDLMTETERPRSENSAPTTEAVMCCTGGGVQSSGAPQQI
ncbi:uncharacterized protein LOC139918031 [Centroberyx gerrardi]